MNSSQLKLRHERGRVELVNQIFYPEIIEQTFEQKNICFFTIKGASLKVTILNFFLTHFRRKPNTQKISFY